MKNIKLFIISIILVCLYSQTYAIANPASVKCNDDGWKLSIVKDSSWSESWICTFNDGTSCEEWAYFRWECKKKVTVEVTENIPWANCKQKNQNDWKTPIPWKYNCTLEVCTKVYAPVCAEVQVQCIKAPCNLVKQTFSNKCEIWWNKNAKFLYEWECKTEPIVIEEPIMCTMDYNPVCWKDWVTYWNKCSAWKKEIAYEWECKTDPVIIEDPILICTKEYNPVCWKDWVTYWNKCSAWKKEIDYEWECKKNTELDLKPKKVSYNWYKIQTENNLANIYVSYNLTKNTIANEKITSYINDYIDNFVKNISEEDVHDGLKYELNITWEYKKVWSILTYKLTIYEFALWAHGNTNFKTFNFLPNWKEIVLKNNKLLQKIADYSLNYFKKQDINPDEEWLKLWLENNEENYSNWLITWYSKETSEKII
jgi:hypothetical protein